MQFIFMAENIYSGSPVGGFEMKKGLFVASQQQTFAPGGSRIAPLMIRLTRLPVHVPLKKKY
jgi:hypothetical protein